MMTARIFIRIMIVCSFFAVLASAQEQRSISDQLPVRADSPTENWPTYGGNDSAWRYSKLNQINQTNVQKLIPVWAFQTRELFFDLSNERNCGICHRVRDAGSSVGPALDTLSNNSPSEILASILEPNAKSALEIRTTSGETICGIKAGGDSTSLRLYDLPSAGPPVLRTFPLPKIAQRGSCSNLKVHADFAHLFTRKQLSDIVAFLKSAE
jgi:hypothetical protein